MNSIQNLTYSYSQKAREHLGTLSAQGVILSLASHASGLNGWTNADCSGKSPRTFVHPEEIHRMEEGFSRVVEGESITLRDVRCLARNGTYVPNDLTFIPVVVNGTVAEVLLMGSLRSQAPVPPALEALGHAKLLESLLANAPIGFALLNEELRFVVLNEVFSRMTEFSPEQHVGMELQHFFPSGAFLAPILQNIFATGNAVTQYELEVAGDRCADMSFYPIPDASGGTCGIAAIAVDITDRKRADEKLKVISDELSRSNRALESFSQIISHDLREPLRTITSFVKLLQKEYQAKLDGPAAEYIRFIVQGTEHMRQLIDGTLNFAKAGKTVRDFAEVDCEEILANVLRNLSHAVEECRGTITSDPLPKVVGDATLLHQVLQNLIANAVKYRTPPTCRIHVGVKREAGRWVFSVQDDGIGICPRDIPSLFEPFRRLHDREQYEGAGLGLSICKKNIERLGGTIWAESQLGKGSTFYFSIPFARAKQEGA